MKIINLAIISSFILHVFSKKHMQFRNSLLRNYIYNYKKKKKFK